MQDVFLFYLTTLHNNNNVTSFAPKSLDTSPEEHINKELVIVKLKNCTQFSTE